MAASIEDLPESEKRRLLTEARETFLSQYGPSAATKYDSRDVDRVRECDTWMQHFLLHQKYRVPETVKMMDGTLSWRKEFGVNDVSEEGIPLQYRQRGAVYFHNKNVSGNDILYFKIKLNKKGDQEAVKAARQIIVYLLENYQRRKPLHRVVALLDMTDVGISNVDIDLTKFLITCFTTYFPGMLEYLLVYDMPWIINTVWTVVKLMLSEDEQKHVIFCKKNSIQQYIDKSQLYRHMGGTDTHTYTYTSLLADVELDDDDDEEDDTTTYQEPEDRGNGDNGEQVPPVTPGNKLPLSLLPDIAQQVSDADSSKAGGSSKKHVNWATNDDVKEFTPPPPSPPPGGAIPNGGNIAESGSSTTSKPATLHVTVVPTSELQFTRAGINEEASCSLKLTNDQSVVLAYKVKTTDPKNYRVKQGRGILAPSHSDVVHITLLAGKEIKRDKFLVLSTKVASGDMTPGELSALWKTLTKSQIHEHKLRCHEAVLDLDNSVNPVVLSGNSSLNGSSTSNLSSVSKSKTASQELTTPIELRLEHLQAELEQVKLLLKVVLALLILVIAMLFIK